MANFMLPILQIKQKENFLIEETFDLKIIKIVQKFKYKTEENGR